MSRLFGKTAIITGGASGIGREIAILFSQHGANVVLVGLEEDKLNCIKEEIGEKVEIHCVDITDEKTVVGIVEKTEEKFGVPDILVNCAGIYAEGTATKTDYSTWQKIIDVNLSGAFLCSKYVASSMLKRGTGGTIINISSEAGIAAIAGQVAYNVSKAAMISLSNSMAVDYAQDNIRVNCVCPGRVLTPLVQNIIDNSENPKETFDKLSHDRPVMRMGAPKDIAYACLHFADNSMPYATGAVLSVDGGYTAR